jgi:hypothetical protein
MVPPSCLGKFVQLKVITFVLHYLIFWTTRHSCHHYFDGNHKGPLSNATPTGTILLLDCPCGPTCHGYALGRCEQVLKDIRAQPDVQDARKLVPVLGPTPVAES